ncbi:unnamed protein product [Lampetra fluviatilis]
MCSLPAVPDRGVQLRAVAFDFSEGNARIHRLHSPLARLKGTSDSEEHPSGRTVRDLDSVLQKDSDKTTIVRMEEVFTGPRCPLAVPSSVHHSRTGKFILDAMQT